MKKGKLPGNLKAMITARSFAKRKREEAEKRSVGGLKEALSELADRAAMVVGREIRSEIAKDKARFTEDPKAEPELRKRLHAIVWSELIAGLSETIGAIPSELPEPGYFRDAEKVSKHGTWRIAVLEPRHIERYGERKCEGCGRLTIAFDRVTWRVPQGEKIWHEACRPKEMAPQPGEGKSAKSAIRCFELQSHHVKRHGERNCSTCGEALKLADMVLWKFGAKKVAHERCGL